MTTRPSVLNRTSTSKIPGPPLQSSRTTLISASASLSGTHPISLGANTIIQIRARINSTYGPINIGDNCIVSERASIGLLSQPEPTQNKDGTLGVFLAPGVLIESGATIEAASIGANTIVEAGAKVGQGAIVGENCKICALVELGERAVVGDRMVVYGSGWGECRSDNKKEETEGIRRAAVVEQADVLKRCWTGK